MFPHSLAAGPLPHCHEELWPGAFPGPEPGMKVLLCQPPTPLQPPARHLVLPGIGMEESAGLESTSPRFKSWLC